MSKKLTLKENRVVIRSRIHVYVKEGYSANKIQKTFQNENIRIRRKILLSEIRAVKKQSIKSDSYKYTRKEYRVLSKANRNIRSIWKKRELIEQQKRERIYKEGKLEKVKVMYRCSRGITGVPIHSTSQKPNYYGFTIFAYSVDKAKLELLKGWLGNKLKELTSRYLHYSWSELDGWVSDYIGWESPVKCDINKSYSGTWEFIVENKGVTVHSESGSL